MSSIASDRNRIIKFGDVFMMNFIGEGSIQTGYRPGIVVQNNTGNMYSPIITVVPLTSKIKRVNMPTHVLIKSDDSGLLKDSVALCENTIPIPRFDIRTYITTLSKEYMRKISIAVLSQTGCLSMLTNDDLIMVYSRNKELNYT